MTELQLYKWIMDNNIEWHWEKFDNRETVLIFPYTFHFRSFADLIKDACSEEGIQCHIKDGYFAVDLQDVCDYFGIDMEEVFRKEATHE